jgi:hypothetical protein
VAVSRKELKEYLKITSDIMITNVISNSNKIFQWEFNYYNCLGNVDIQAIEEEFLDEIITEMFAENQNYCSAKMIFDYCQQLMPELLERNHIKNATNLFYLVATLMGNKNKYRIPHVLPSGSVLSTTEDIARMFVGTPKTLSWKDFSTMSDRFGWGESTAGIVFDSITKNDYYRISRTDYVRKEEFVITQEQVVQVREVLSQYFNQKLYIGIWEIKFDGCPDIGYDWTMYLFETIISNYVKDYRIITPNYGINKIERGVFVSSSAGISSFDEIVVRVMKASGRVSISESEMYTMLVLSGIIKNSIPNELRESKLLIFKDGVYTIKESV